MKCVNCAFWTENKGRGPWGNKCPDNFGGCRNSKIESTMHIGANAWQGYSDDTMITEYDEEWGFYVGANFGCIHFEAK